MCGFGNLSKVLFQEDNNYKKNILIPIAHYTVFLVAPGVWVPV
jgi:hypothetical protein